MWCNMTFGFVTPLVLALHHMMPIALSIVPLHSFGQDIQNEVQLDLFSNVTPLALASHDSDGIVNGYISFFKFWPIRKSCNMAFLVIWDHWCQHWHHVMKIALSMPPLHSLGEDNKNEIQQDFLVIWHHWCQYWHHMMPVTLLIAPLHFPGQDDQDEVQNHFFDHAMPLAPASQHHQWHHCIL